MNRWLPFALLLLTSCGQRTYTVAECRALAEPKAVVERCVGGDLETGQYIGDLKCWPFSEPERRTGIWVIDLESSQFYPNARTVEELGERRSQIWLESDLLDHRPELLAAAQGAGTRAYWVEILGRRSLCEGMFGHMGLYPHQVIVDRFDEMRQLSLSGG